MIRSTWKHVILIAMILGAAGAARADVGDPWGWRGTMPDDAIRARGTYGVPDPWLGESEPAADDASVSLGVAGPAASDGPFEFVYRLPETEAVTLQVFDAGGHRIAMVDEGIHAAGEHFATWDPDDSDVPSGMYLVVLDAGDVRETVRVARTD